MDSRLTINRKHSFAGREAIAWFFANRKWIRGGKSSLIEAAWAKRPLPIGEAGIRFLILAPKRSYKAAHDRNKVKRWLRAAVTETPDFVELESKFQLENEQCVVMLRISKQMANLSWSQIRDEVHKITRELQKRMLLEQNPKKA